MLKIQEFLEFQISKSLEIYSRRLSAESIESELIFCSILRGRMRSDKNDRSEWTTNWPFHRHSLLLRENVNLVTPKTGATRFEKDINRVNAILKGSNPERSHNYPWFVRPNRLLKWRIHKDSTSLAQICSLTIEIEIERSCRPSFDHWFHYNLVMNLDLINEVNRWPSMAKGPRFWVLKIRSLSKGMFEHVDSPLVKVLSPH